MKVSQKLIKNAINGDVEAIDKLIDILSPLIYYVAAGKIHCKSEAEDCTQYILERLMRKLHLYDPKKTSFTTWFYAVIRNAYKNYYARHYVNETIEFNDEEVYNYTSQTREVNLRKDRLSSIEEYIGEELYEILMLRIGYEMTFYEISDILNIPYHKAKRDFNSAYKLAKQYTEKMK